MNLEDLTDAAQCNLCNGEWHWCKVCKAGGTDGVHNHTPGSCPRCVDHPGIDPDVILERGAVWERAFRDVAPAEGAFFVVVAVDPT